MASRDVTNQRSVTNVVAPQAGYSPNQVTQLVGMAADYGKKLIAENQHAKITENFSVAQIELNKLNQQYQIDYESDPLGGMEKYKQARDGLFTKLGDDISPFFKKDWQDSTRDLGYKDTASMEAWAFGQTKKNTVKAINRTIQNNLSQATVDGQNFGNSDQTEVGSALNYGLSKDKLTQFGDKNLGAETTTSILEDYDGDYLKSFLSGVSETSPLKALRLMDDPNVKASFKDQRQYGKMKDAIENRALHVQEINAQKQVLSTLKDENSLLTRSLEAPVSYADLQKEFDRTNMSPSAQSFFMKANGYTKADGSDGKAKLSPSEQVQAKAEFYSNLTEFTGKENLTSADIADFQAKTYTAMDQKVLDEKEGIAALSQIVSPLVEQKEAQFKNFSQDSWIAPDIGFSGVQKMFNDEIAVQPAEGEKEVGQLTQTLNDTNKVKLYDYYMTALQTNAASYGVPVGGITQLNNTQQRKLYSEAQASAKKAYMLDTNPALSTLPDLPNQVFKGGQLIQGAAGNRDLKPDVTAPTGFKAQVGNDGYLYRLYPDGKRERVGKAPEGVKF